MGGGMGGGGMGGRMGMGGGMGSGLANGAAFNILTVNVGKKATIQTGSRSIAIHLSAL